MSAVSDHLDLIAGMSQDFAQSGDIEQALRRGLLSIVETVGAEAASLFLLEDDGLVCHACAGPVDLTGLRLAPGTGIVGSVVAGNRARMVRDVRQDPDFGATVDAETGFVTRSVLCAPMAVRDQRLGAIELINKRDHGLFGPEDAQLLQALAASAALALVNARLAAAMVEQERVRRELELAAEIQRGMLPRTAGGPVTGFNRPAREVSGDFYDVISLADGRIAFCIGDVSGKGLNAALLMARCASLFRCLVKVNPRPGRLLAAINAELCETGATGVFVTMVAGLYDPAGGRVVLANAGHEPALLRSRGGGFAEFPAAAPPLGIAAEMLRDGVREAAFDLAGGSLYLFTDGLTECRTGDGMLGGEGVRRLIGGCDGIAPADVPGALLEMLAEMGGAIRDDLTLLLVRDGRE